jgi:ABC-2 type transport system permease protein
MKAGITTRFKKSLRTRAFRAGAYSVFAGLLVAAIAVALNLIVSALPSSVTQMDVTASGLYTVSEQTRQIVSGLTKDVAIYWLVQPTTEEGALERLLENYKELSPRVSVKKIDPVEFPNFAAEYTDEKIYNNTLIVVCGGRNRVLGYYDIFKYDYQSDYYGASGYGYDVSFAGEEALTSALDYVTSEDLPVAYALSGHGEAKLPGTRSPP